MPELDLDTVQESARTERLERERQQRREVLPLEYSAKSARPPFDWLGAVRQLIFAIGVAFITGGIVSWQGSYSVWRNGEVFWIAIGAFFLTLPIPWPGRVGFKRSQ
jgi:hypothetical protein